MVILDKYVPGGHRMNTVLLWEYDMENIDWQKSKTVVAQCVVELGTLEDFYAAFDPKIIHNMRKLVFIFLALFAGIGAEAQETLIPINEETVSIKGYDREIERLLVPATTEFGMICRPSFEVESSLIYDSVAHALVYIEAETSIWSRFQQASSFLEKNVWKTKKINFYHAPGTKMYFLPIRDEMVQAMRGLWNAAIGQAKFPKKERKEWKTEDGEVLIVEVVDIVLDGTGWEYFLNGKRATIQGDDKGGKGKVGSLINLCIELREAVRENNSQKMEALHPKVDSLYRMFE